MIAHNVNFCNHKNRKTAGALFLPLFSQICLPYAPCRLSPPVIEPQAS
nr:MAG TPA: hypothetical protein [Caudoviricetes sp.]